MSWTMKFGVPWKLKFSFAIHEPNCNKLLKVLTQDFVQWDQWDAGGIGDINRTFSKESK